MAIEELALRVAATTVCACAHPRVGQADALPEQLSDMGDGVPWPESEVIRAIVFDGSPYSLHGLR